MNQIAPNAKVRDHHNSKEALPAPRWTSRKYSKAMKQDRGRDTEFHQKASHVLQRDGFSQPAIGRVLGISERSVRSHLSQPSKADQDELEATAKRERMEQHSRTKQGKAPFDVWAYLAATRPPRALELLGFDPWTENQKTGTTTREKVAFYIEDDWSVAQIARLLRISRQAVEKHVEKLGRDVRKGTHLRKVRSRGK